MHEDTIKSVEKYIKDMPSFSTTVAKALEICNNPQSSPADLNRVISLDPVLAAKVLRLTNSAYDRLAHPVTNLVRAIIMVGINTVKNMALSTAILVNPATKDSTGLSMDGFWRHSICTGIAAKLIAKKRNIADTQLEKYYIAGLLHDIGKIPLNAVKARKYREAIELADRDHIDLYRAEKHVLDFDHCDAGKIIVEAWHLEGAIGDVVSFHHSCPEYKGPYRDILYTVVMANRFSSVMDTDISGDRFSGPLAPGILEYLAVGEDIFGELEFAVKKKIEDVLIFLEP
ncbi:MAG: HDOD domain-containing protein [Treponema sp.]|jgi:HD-like signal output (HDOD) protein|nr:HDOD domain-containing protein [Treponema sp.]